MITDQNGDLPNGHDYFPFGEEIASAYGSHSTVAGYGSPDSLNQQFTGKDGRIVSVADQPIRRWIQNHSARSQSNGAVKFRAQVRASQRTKRLSFKTGIHSVAQALRECIDTTPQVI